VRQIKSSRLDSLNALKANRKTLAQFLENDGRHSEKRSQLLSLPAHAQGKKLPPFASAAITTTTTTTTITSQKRKGS